MTKFLGDYLKITVQLFAEIHFISLFIQLSINLRLIYFLVPVSWVNHATSKLIETKYLWATLI